MPYKDPEVKRQKQREYQRVHRAKHLRSRKQSKLKIHYGMTLEDWDRMCEEQKGCCKICGVHRSELKQELHVDHCHKTGLVRGLLCQRCNRAIGLFGDSPDLLQKAKEYLDAPFI